MAKTVFRGRVIKVYSVTRTLPNGIKTTVDVVEHPGAVLILPFLGQDRIILLRQYRPSIKKYLWELPAGTLKPKESPVRCAKRELVEETGYQAQRILKLGKIYPVPGYSTEVITLFQAEKLSRQYAAKDKDEVIEARSVSIKDVKKMFNAGRIMDAKTICALALSRLLS